MFKLLGYEMYVFSLFINNDLYLPVFLSIILRTYRANIFARLSFGIGRIIVSVIISKTSAIDATLYDTTL